MRVLLKKYLEIDGLKLAFNNPDLYSAKGLNLKNDAGVIDTDTYYFITFSRYC